MKAHSSTAAAAITAAALILTSGGLSAAPVYHVRAGGTGNGSSWMLAGGDLQVGIETIAAAGGGQVWVAEGSYLPTSHPNGGTLARERHFSLRNRVQVLGGFPPKGDPGPADRDPVAHPTVCSGDIGIAGQPADNVYHVFDHPSSAGLDNSARLDGFTITLGNADGLGSQADGGGMFNDVCEPVIVRCVIAGNRAGDGGGGIYNARCNPLITHCVVHDNDAAAGGGMFNGRSSPRTIACLFHHNTAGQGAAILNDTNGSPQLSSCTLFDNRASGTGGGLLNRDSSLPQLDNTILWGNGGGEVVDQTASASTLEFCVIDGGWPGAGSNNLDDDPRFADPRDPAGSDGRWRTDDDGLRVLGDSPAIDSGKDSLLPADLSDIDGDGDSAEALPLDLRLRPRIARRGLDRGSYEQQLYTVTFNLGSHGTRTGGGALEQEVPEGDDAWAPTIAVQFGWLFTGWDRPFTAISTDLTVTAQYAPVFAAGGVCFVRQGGTGNGTSWAEAAGGLQPAIEAMHSVGGGAVWVAEGTYLPGSHPNGGGTAREQHFSLRNNVRVLGGFPPTGDPSMGARDPALHPTVCSGDLGTAGDPSDNAYHVFHHPPAAALDASAVLDGFVITGGRANGAPPNNYGGGMFNDFCSPTLARCRFADNQALAQGGGLYLGHSTSTIANCVFVQDSAREGGGVFLNESTASLANCVFTSCSASLWGGAVHCYTGGAPVITNCTFAGNPATVAGGALYSSAGTPILANSVLWGNSPDQIAGSAPTLNHCIIEGGWAGAGTNNLTADPQFLAPADPDGPDNLWGTADDGLIPAATSPAISTGNSSMLPPDVADLDGDTDTVEPLPRDLALAPRVRGGAVDRGAYEPLVAQVYHVRDGGTGAGHSWADAAGDLQDAIDAAAAAGNSQVWVAEGHYLPDGFPNGNAVPRGEHFALRNEVPVLGGFPPTGDPGLADRNPPVFPTVCSGDLGTAGDPADNAFHIFYHPPGAALNASARLDGVIITGANGNGSPPHNYGAGMFNSGCSPTLVRCVFQGNQGTGQGGGLYLGDAVASVTNCAFDGNQSVEGGGAFIYQSNISFANCVFVANAANNGGAVHAYKNGAPAFANCTFTGNSSSLGGGAIRVNNAPVTVANSILWGNLPNQVSGLPAATLACCLVEGGWSGTGNFSGDPGFLVPPQPSGNDHRWFTGDDGLRLRSDSLAANSGSTALVPPDAADLDGDGDSGEPLPQDVLGAPRAFDGIPDLGAYELTPSGVSIPYWRSLHFSGPDRADPAKESTVWGNFADPEGDDIPNCGEYLLLLDPNARDNPLAAAARTNYLGLDWLAFNYTKAKNRGGVTANVETSTDLQPTGWNPSGCLVRTLDETATTITYQVLLPISPPRGFMRFSFTMP